MAGSVVVRPGNTQSTLFVSLSHLFILLGILFCVIACRKDGMTERLDGLVYCTVHNMG